MTLYSSVISRLKGGGSSRWLLALVPLGGLLLGLVLGALAGPSDTASAQTPGGAQSWCYAHQFVPPQCTNNIYTNLPQAGMPECQAYKLSFTANMCQGGGQGSKFHVVIKDALGNQLYKDDWLSGSGGVVTYTTPGSFAAKPAILSVISEGRQIQCININVFCSNQELCIPPAGCEPVPTPVPPTPVPPTPIPCAGCSPQGAYTLTVKAVPDMFVESPIDPLHELMWVRKGTSRHVPLTVTARYVECGGGPTQDVSLSIDAAGNPSTTDGPVRLVSPPGTAIASTERTCSPAKGAQAMGSDCHRESRYPIQIDEHFTLGGKTYLFEKVSVAVVPEDAEHPWPGVARFNSECKVAVDTVHDEDAKTGYKMVPVSQLTADDKANLKYRFALKSLPELVTVLRSQFEHDDGDLCNGTKSICLAFPFTEKQLWLFALEPSVLHGGLHCCPGDGTGPGHAFPDSPLGCMTAGGYAATADQPIRWTGVGGTIHGWDVDIGGDWDGDGNPEATCRINPSTGIGQGCGESAMITGSFVAGPGVCSTQLLYVSRVLFDSYRQGLEIKQGTYVVNRDTTNQNIDGNYWDRPTGAPIGDCNEGIVDVGMCHSGLLGMFTWVDKFPERNVELWFHEPPQPVCDPDLQPLTGCQPPATVSLLTAVYYEPYVCGIDEVRNRRVTREFPGGTPVQAAIDHVAAWSRPTWGSQGEIGQVLVPPGNFGGFVVPADVFVIGSGPSTVIRASGPQAIETWSNKAGVQHLSVDGMGIAQFGVNVSDGDTNTFCDLGVTGLRPGVAGAPSVGFELDDSTSSNVLQGSRFNNVGPGESTGIRVRGNNTVANNQANANGIGINVLWHNSEVSGNTVVGNRGDGIAVAGEQAHGNTLANNFLRCNGDHELAFLALPPPPGTPPGTPARPGAHHNTVIQTNGQVSHRNADWFHTCSTCPGNLPPVPPIIPLPCP